MKCAILINAYSVSQPWVSQALRLKEEFAALGVCADVLKNDSFRVYIKDGKIVNGLSDYDFAVYLDKDKYISRMLEACGMKLYNSHAAIRDCDDKFDTYIRLCGAGVNMPDSMPGLLCYRPEQRVPEETYGIIESRFGYPVIIKTCYGSYGDGVYLVRDRAGLVDALDNLKMQPYLIQRYIKSSAGHDVRVIVIGKKTAAWMLRQSQNGDFRSNIERGGQGHITDLPEGFAKTAETCASVLGLDYCGVDIMFGERGEPVVCEVNSNAFFEGMEAVTGINVAGLYCGYIIEDMKK